MRGVGTWLHLSAMNVIAQHEAGVEVAPGKLEMARKMVAELGPARAHLAGGAK